MNSLFNIFVLLFYYYFFYIIFVKVLLCFVYYFFYLILFDFRGRSNFLICEESSRKLKKFLENSIEKIIKFNNNIKLIINY